MDAVCRVRSENGQGLSGMVMVVDFSLVWVKSGQLGSEVVEFGLG